jgi:hypothetical protein
VGNESGESDTSGEQDTGEGGSLPSAELELEPTSNRAEPVTEPAILDSDLIWFDDRYASCYDRKTDLWIVYGGVSAKTYSVTGSCIVTMPQTRAGNRLQASNLMKSR